MSNAAIREKIESTLSSEWCGLFNEKEVIPKSFRAFDAESKSLAYSGLFQLIADVKDQKNFLFDQSNSISRIPKTNYKNLFIYFTLEKIRSKVQGISRMRYISKSQNAEKVKGRIDFSKTISNNYGLKHKVFCHFKEQTNNSDLLFFIAQATRMISTGQIKFSNNTVQAAFNTTCNEIIYYLGSMSSTKSFVTICVDICNNQRIDNNLYAELYPFAKVLANLIIGNFIGSSDGQSDRGAANFNFVLNLNRPFETLIRSALELVPDYKSKSEFISEFTLAGSEKVVFHMRPDCWGHIKDQLVIIDAKHKLISSDIESDNVDTINRADLYQMISYIRANRHMNNHGIYCLIGLNEEIERGRLSNYINPLQDIHIPIEGSKKIVLQRKAMNFGSLLCDLAEDYNRAIAKLAVELTSTVL